MAAAVGAAFAGAIPSPGAFGFGQIGMHQSMDAQKSMIRHLRRREYQDMMFSMKEAGLNPMLASGATPGHWGGGVAGPSASMNQIGPGAGQALAAGSQAATAAKVGGTTASLQSAKAAHEWQQRLNTIFSRAGLLQQFDMNRADMEKTIQDTRTSSALEAVYGKQAGVHSANALWLDEQREQLARYGPSGRWQDQFMKGIGTWLTDDKGSPVRDLFMPPVNPFNPPVDHSQKNSAKQSPYEAAAEAAVKYPYSNMLQAP